jgi:hypothetical protein
VRQRRIVQAFGMTVLGLALACAPMAVASAHSKKHHPKPKHHATKTVAKAALNPGSKLCAEAYAGESNTGDVGSSLEKAMVSAETSGNFDAAKPAMIAAINASLKEEAPAEAALSSAPANVQAAMKGLFGYVQSFETAINNASSFTQFATSMESLVQNSGIQADSTTLANYLTEQCGPPPTTTTTTTAVSLP